MSAVELKEEVIRQFDVKVEAMEDETALMEVLDFLNGLNSDVANDVNLSRQYNAINAKYGDVLKKLAE